MPCCTFHFSQKKKKKKILFFRIQFLYFVCCACMSGSIVAEMCYFFRFTTSIWLNVLKAEYWELLSSQHAIFATKILLFRCIWTKCAQKHHHHLSRYLMFTASQLSVFFFFFICCCCFFQKKTKITFFYFVYYTSNASPKLKIEHLHATMHFFQLCYEINLKEKIVFRFE